MIALLVLVASLASAAPPCIINNAVGGGLGRSVPHIHLVDVSRPTSGANNFLFRGGTPDVGAGDTFDFRALNDGIAAEAQNSGITLPSQYLVTVINVMSFKQGSFDSRESMSEFKYFQQNPSAGSFVFWHTKGSGTNATSADMTSPLRQYLAATADAWLEDYLPERATELWNMLNTATPTPTVFYLHCDCGCDRTGEVIGAYELQNLQMDFPAVQKRNTQIANRPMMCSPYLALQWFCLYLQSQKGYNNLNCLGSFPCTPDM